MVGEGSNPSAAHFMIGMSMVTTDVRMEEENGKIVVYLYINNSIKYKSTALTKDQAKTTAIDLIKMSIDH